MPWRKPCASDGLTVFPKALTEQSSSVSHPVRKAAPGRKGTRNESAGILYAISREDVGVVVAPMEDEVYDSILEDAFKNIKEDGVDITELTRNWEKFLSCRNDVEALLPESVKSLYNKDTQRYMKFVSSMVNVEY